MAKSSIYTTPKNTQQPVKSVQPAPAAAPATKASGSVYAAPASVVPATAAAPAVPGTPYVVIENADKGKTTGFLLLRLLLGLMLLLSGTEKFKSPDSPYYYSFQNWHDTKNEQTGVVEKSGRWLTVAKPVYEFGGFNNPAVFGEKGSNFLSWTFYWFAQTLPYTMVIAGFMILVGLFTRFALFLGGAIWLSLAAGQMTLPDNPTVFMLSMYVLMYALAASLVRFNRFAITRF